MHLFSLLLILRLGYECPLNYNPADFYIHTLAIVPGAEEECRQRVAQICDAFMDSEEGKALAKEVGLSKDELTGASPNDLSDDKLNNNEKTSKYKASWIAQFLALLSRSWTANLREPMVVKIRLMQTLVSKSLLNHYDDHHDYPFNNFFFKGCEPRH